MEVTVIPEDDALRRIWQIANLRKLKIHIVRPNADDIDPEAVLDELVAQGARCQDIILTADTNGDGLEPNARTKMQAEVAEHNGFVEGNGRDAHGQKVSLSTKAYPRVISSTIGGVSGYIALALRIAKETLIR